MADKFELKSLPKREEVTWTTFEGESRKVYELDGQHLCNIYYYMKYVSPEFYRRETKLLIASEIDKRFDGQPLEYRPLRRFASEIRFLEQKGWLVKNEQENITYVVIDGKRIGQVLEE